MFTTTKVYHFLVCVRWVYHGHFLFLVFLHCTTTTWKIDRRAMTTETLDLMEAVLCNIQPGRCKP